MSDLHPINRALLTILDNQVARTDAALENLPGDALDTCPGGDCNTILAIGRHLVMLRRFQLSLLESPLQDDVPDPESVRTLEDLIAGLTTGAELIHRGITEHDPDDWYAVPETPRSGHWGDEPTIIRLSRPLNDYVNHLGAMRAIRRILGCPAGRTQ